MSVNRRQMSALLAGAPLLGAAPAALAQRSKDSVVLGITLEPPYLDPSNHPSSAIGEVVHYNILEGLTKITMGGAVLPLLAESWRRGPEAKTYVFQLRRGVSFSDGSPFDARAVKFSIDRARAETSRNKTRTSVFENIRELRVQSSHAVVFELDDTDFMLPFRMGQSPAVMLHPNSAAHADTRPVGTGPYRLQAWDKGRSITLERWAGHRLPVPGAFKRASFRFIDDPQAQVAALRAGEIDAMPRLDALSAVKALRADRRFTVEVGSTAGKTLLAINNRKPPFNDLRVRQAIAHAVDRKAFIAGALAGLATPIGSHFSPNNIGYVDLTRQYPHDPAKARALLRDAGVTTPLAVRLALPPPAYARLGGEIIAAQLAAVGLQVTIDKLDWPQWLDGPFKGEFDLTLINHVEPGDYADAYADPDYYFGYDNPLFRGLVATLKATDNMAQKARLWASVQRQLADDCVNAWLCNPSQVAVFRKGLRGVWSSSPIVANELAALRWDAKA